MTIPLQFTGTIAPGLGEASGFTEIPWVKAAFREHLGIDAWPGTLNLVVDGGNLETWRAVTATPGVLIPAGAEGFCDSRGWPVTAGANGTTCAAAILLPDVPDYPAEKVELIADRALREALRVAEGDAVTLKVHT